MITSQTHSFHKSMIASLLSLSSLLTLCGCSQSRELCDVQGQLLINGKPAQGAYLVFHPLGEQPPEDHPVEPTAVRTNSDGTYHWKFHRAGEYSVTLFWPLVSQTAEETIEGPDRFKGKFANENSPIASVTISTGENSLAPIELNTRRS